MISSWQLYWLTLLDGAINCITAMTIITFVLSVGSLLVCVFAETESYGGIKKWWRFPIIAGIMMAIFSIIGIFIPTTKQMAAILIVPKLTNALAKNEELKGLPDNLVALANDWINELKPKREESQSK